PRTTQETPMRFAQILELLCFLAWIIVAVLVDAFLNAWAMSQLWHWFAAAQYGAGPTLSAWFGLAVIARLAIQGEADKESILKQLKNDDAPSLKKVVWESRASWSNVLFTILLAWGLGSALHWIR